jgi:hypothetical protein
VYRQAEGQSLVLTKSQRDAAEDHERYMASVCECGHTRSKHSVLAPYACCGGETYHVRCVCKAFVTVESKVWAALEQARQNIKPIVKKEREAEALSAELLNFRLREKGE